MSVYDEVFLQFRERMVKELMAACDRKVLAAFGRPSPAHPLPKCKTCGDTGLVEDLYEGHGGLVFVTCPDCPAEPFPLP